MRAVKIAVAIMSVLIVVGVTVVVVTLVNRMAGNSGGSVLASAAVMDEPAGTSISGIAAAGDRLAVQLHGGGPDRVVFIDPRTATVAGRISLTK